MNPWQILGIPETDDKEKVRKAYMELLPKFNPEEDPEGFNNLRLAYEQALKQAEEKDKPKEITPVTIFMDKFAALYNDFSRRIDTANWEILLKDEVLIALETEDTVHRQIMEFLMANFYLPTEVWKLLDKKFNWSNRSDELKKIYPPGFIDYIIKNLIGDYNIFYHLFDTSEEKDFTKFITLRGELGFRLDKRILDNIDEMVSQIEELGIDHPDYSLEKARLLGLRGETEQALEILQNVLNKYPEEYGNLYYFYFVKGEILSNQNDKEKLQKAIIPLKKVLELRSDNYMTKITLMEVFMKLEEYKKAKDLIIEQMLPIYPSDEYVLSALSKIGEVLPRDKDAPQNLEEAYELAEASKSYKNYASILAFLEQEEKEDEALEVMEKALLLPADGYDKVIKAHMYNHRANIYFKRKEYRRALEEIENSLLTHDKMAFTYYLKALIYREYGYLREAMEEAGKATFFSPNYREPYELEAEILEEVGNFEEAASIYEFIQNYTAAAEIFAGELNNLKKALEMSVKALEQNKDNPDISFYLGDLYYADGDYEKAIEIFTSNINKNKDKEEEDAYDYLMRALSYEKLGKKFSAKSDYKRTLKISSQKEKATYHGNLVFIGRALIGLGKVEEALKYFEDAELLMTTDGTTNGVCHCVYRGWAFYYSAINNKQKALENIEKAISIRNSVVNNRVKADIQAQN